MTLRFTVLASGSSGNATYLEANDLGILLDIGLGPRELATRLGKIGASWDDVHAVLLTHTHTDHWNDRTFMQLRSRRIPIYCHASHSRRLGAACDAFAGMRSAKLIRHYKAETAFELPSGIRCQPLPLSHDGGATFGFRLETAASLFHRSWAIGYLADLGCWDAQLVAALVDVDLLALEFNHDVEMEQSSGRTANLIARVVGDEGHLSNEQAAQFLEEVLRCSTPGRLKHLIQLHLSRECNTPELAARVARTTLGRLGFDPVLHTASQYDPSPTFAIGMPAAEAPPNSGFTGNSRIPHPNGRLKHGR
jgi:phosphoribosyl 1,2-cyclic phosphodiesterase